MSSQNNSTNTSQDPANQPQTNNNPQTNQTFLPININGSGQWITHNGWFVYNNTSQTSTPTDPPVEAKKKDLDGCFCKKCDNFYEFAEPNQEDGTLICWSCRHGY